MKGAMPFRSLTVEWEVTRSVGDFPWLGSVLLSSIQCFDSVDWVTGRASGP